MNNQILIAVGGTGARIAQSVVAMAAAGLSAELGVNSNATKSQMYIKLVDIDVDHKDGQELYDMIESYNATVGEILEANPSAFGDKKWRPMKIRMVDKPEFVFDAQLGGAGIKKEKIEDIVVGLKDEPRLLLDSLISKNDRDMNLLAGCKARPRIGALLWQYLYNMDTQGFWQDIRNMMTPGNTTRIMFAGSVFGGTGASGVPTLAKLLRQSLKNDVQGTNSFGITLMSPYFQLTPPEDAPVQSKKFPFESKMAMRYYESDMDLLQMDCVQIVGDELHTMITNVEKRKDKDPVWQEISYTPDITGEQNNPSMPAELVAAIGIHMFFAGKEDGNLMMHGHEVQYEEKASDVHSINMLPSASESGICLYRLSRFCHIMNDYCNMLADEAPRKKPAMFHKLWDEGNLGGIDWREKSWKNRDVGVGHILDFSENINRWLNDLEQNGMRDVLHFERECNEIRNAACHGSTSFSSHGIKGNRILGTLNSQVNSFFKDITNVESKLVPQIRQRVLMSALLEACTEA